MTLVALDVISDESAAIAAVKTAKVDTFGSLDVVVNNAGFGNLSSVEDTPMSGFSRANRNEPLWDDHCDKGSSFRISAEGRAAIFVQFSSMGRKDRTSGSRALLGCEMGR